MFSLPLSLRCPFSRLMQLHLADCYGSWSANIQIYFTGLQLLPTCKILDANYNHNFNELILQFLDYCCCRGIDKSTHFHTGQTKACSLRYNLQPSLPRRRSLGFVTRSCPTNSLGGRRKGEGGGEKSAKAWKRERVSYPLSPIPLPFSLPPYGPTPFSAC